MTNTRNYHLLKLKDEGPKLSDKQLLVLTSIMFLTIQHDDIFKAIEIVLEKEKTSNAK